MEHNNTIPDINECYRLMERYEMLPNIIAHSEQVMQVALIITDSLVDTASVNRERIAAAALLHDITKTRSLTTKERHDITGGELLRGLGYDDIAFIVEEHVYFTEFDPGGGIEEREIVYYADKRVMHDTVVTIEKRVSDLVARYGVTEERRRLIIENKKNILAIEHKIQRFLPVDIDTLLAQAMNVTTSNPGAGESRN